MTTMKRGIAAGVAFGLVAAALAQTAKAVPAAQTAAPAAQPSATAIAPLVGGKDFISPAGEPVRSADTLSGAEHWFRQADANGDRRITPAEFRADADRFFLTLDTDHDGEIGPDEIDHYETDVAPEIRVMSSFGDPSLAKSDTDGNITPPPYPTRLGAGRFGYLDMPEPLVTADGNFDRSISRREMAAAADKRFKMLDTNGDGVITRDELPRLGLKPAGDAHKNRHRVDGWDGAGGGEPMGADSTIPH